MTDGSNDEFLLFTHPQHLNKNIVKDNFFTIAYLGLVIILELFCDFYSFELNECFGLEHDTVELDFETAFSIGAVKGHRVVGLAEKVTISSKFVCVRANCALSCGAE